MASSKKAIYAAIAGNGAIAVTKFIGAAISGSSAMLAEGIHSLVDTGNGGLLLLGQRRAKRPADALHPFGHGQDLYFYSLIVAVLIFGVGGGVTIYEGILHVLHPPTEAADATATVFGITLSGLTINYIVLSVAVCFELYSCYVALVTFKKYKGNLGYWEAIRTGKDPTYFFVLFEDAAALAGLVVALVGISLAHLLRMPVLDGVASITIGVILCTVAGFLIHQAKALLLGESATREVQRSIERLAARDDAIERVGRVLTMHMGPEHVLLNMKVDFRDEISSDEVAASIDRVEQAIRAAHDEVKQIFIEAGSVAAKAH